MIFILTICLGLFLFNFSSAHVAHAAELSFSVSTNIPNNQIDKSRSFFDLEMKPSQKQTVTVLLTNNTSQAITVNVGVNAAKTNLNGVIEYGKSSLKNDKSLKYPLEKLVRYPKTVTIPAKQSQAVPFTITMPNKLYKGIVLGGLTFQQKDDSKASASSSSQKGTVVQNKFVYAVAMILRESAQAVKPVLALASAQPNQADGRNLINARILNKKSLLMSSVKVSAKVYRKGQGTPIYSSTIGNMQIAPNNALNYPIYLKGARMQAGSYTARVQVTATAYKNPQTWHFSKNFQIKASTAGSLNKSTVEQIKGPDYSWVLPAVIIVLLVVMIILLIILLMRRRTSNK
ncbi:hypothetical protein NT95_09110 [Oenococcus kitaharae]|nr:hypothetical protein NT95_09110 [Oenococcus kitaharae]OEY83179.1 hypothetical protein NV75_07210 [Oenococcus kitaharae]OEY84652.1 hypothetical protein NT96_03425 [Oenococcus kitaharae]